MHSFASGEPVGREQLVDVYNSKLDLRCSSLVLSAGI